MKSETLIKINENRKRYLQAYKSQESEKLSQTETNDEEAEVTIQLIPTLRFSAEIHKILKVYSSVDFYKMVKKILLPLALVFSTLKRLNNYMANFLVKRTEKMRARIFSFMLILFDAKI